jgi:predicted ATP-grasp superfamily ATP-dependent carboligase
MTAISTHSPHVLVLGDDMRIFLAVVRAFGRAGKTVHAAPLDMHSPALKSRYIAAIHRLPDYSQDPHAWQEAMLDILRSQSIDLVVPCSDPWIIALDRHRQALAGYNIAIPPAAAMEELFDKEQTHIICGKLGIPVSRAARLDAADTAAALVAAHGLPLVIKPRRSYWLDRLDTWGKVHIVESELQLQEVMAGLPEPSRYLVESYFEGAGVGVSVLAREGEILQAFQHRRLREGKGGSSSYRISEPVNPELRAACAKICTHTRHTGVCMFEFRVDMQTGRWVLLETNARFWGSMPLPLALGLDYPNLLYDLVVRDIAKPERGYEIGVRSRNFLLDGYNLFKRLRQIRPANVIPWLVDAGDFCLQPLRWLGGREYSDSFVLDDIRPALWELVALLRRR